MTTSPANNPHLTLVEDHVLPPEMHEPGQELWGIVFFNNTVAGLYTVDRGPDDSVHALYLVPGNIHNKLPYEQLLHQYLTATYPEYIWSVEG